MFILTGLRLQKEQFFIIIWGGSDGSPSALEPAPVTVERADGQEAGESADARPRASMPTGVDGERGRDGGGPRRTESSVED